jgi:hypothetical protein
MHAFSAGGCILGAELFDTWRRPKRVAEHVAEAQKDHVLAAFLERRSVAPGEPVRARIVSVCDAALGGLTDLGLRAMAVPSTGEAEFIDLGRVNINGRIQVIWEGELPLGGEAGTYDLAFQLCRGDAVLAKGARKAFVVPSAGMSRDRSVCALGPGRDGLEERIQEMGARCVRSPTEATHLVAIGLDAVGQIPFGYRELVGNGRTLLLLVPSPQAIRWAMDCFGISGEIASAVGNWSPVCHHIDDKALQAGLPADAILSQAYADVLPTHCIRTDVGRSLAGCFSYHAGHIFTKQTEVWWGKTVLEQPFGKGRAIVCTFRLEDALAHDPLARKLFVNLLGELGGRAGERAP